MNRQDGGRRHCVSVTNNEVAADEQVAGVVVDGEGVAGGDVAGGHDEADGGVVVGDQALGRGSRAAEANLDVEAGEVGGDGDGVVPRGGLGSRGGVGAGGGGEQTPGRHEGGDEAGGPSHDGHDTAAGQAGQRGGGRWAALQVHTSGVGGPRLDPGGGWSAAKGGTWPGGQVRGAAGGRCETCASRATNSAVRRRLRAGRSLA